MASAYRYLRRSGFSPDIIHGHIYFMAPAAVFLGRLFRKPVVITEHSSRFLRGDIRKADELRLKRNFRRADIVLPVSAALRDSMEKRGISGRYRVIPNTYDPEIFFPPTDAPKGDQRRTVPRMLSVGLFTEPKGIPVLLRAVREIVQGGTQLHLDIVGDGPRRGEYEVLSSELGLERVVAFHGLQDRAAVAILMRGCDFYVQASLWETFGVTIIEAMACGKPIVATRIPAFEEKISRGKGILVPPNDERQLAAGIQEMLQTYASYDAHEIAASARKSYSHEVVGRALSSVYSEVDQGKLISA
jgi:glycosyltransferase involved in cell wall biosynthesis